MANPNCVLVRVSINHDVNERGEMVYLVDATYMLAGRLVTVPDDKGWPTMAEAQAERSRIIDRG